MKRLFTADELADYLAVSPMTVRGWVRDGLIPEVRCTARTRRFDLDEVLSYLRRRQVPGHE